MMGWDGKPLGCKPQETTNKKPVTKKTLRYPASVFHMNMNKTENANQFKNLSPVHTTHGGTPGIDFGYIPPQLVMKLSPELILAYKDR